jgi:hypothetical protein
MILRPTVLTEIIMDMVVMDIRVMGMGMRMSILNIEKVLPIFSAGLGI